MYAVRLRLHDGAFLYASTHPQSRGETEASRLDSLPGQRERISDMALSIMLLDLGVVLGETGHFSEQIAAFEASDGLRPSDLTFANTQRVRQYMCIWKNWKKNMARVASIIDTYPMLLTALSASSSAPAPDMQTVTRTHAHTHTRTYTRVQEGKAADSADTRLVS